MNEIDKKQAGHEILRKYNMYQKKKVSFRNERFYKDSFRRGCSIFTLCPNVQPPLYNQNLSHKLETPPVKGILNTGKCQPLLFFQASGFWKKMTLKIQGGKCVIWSVANRFQVAINGRLQTTTKRTWCF